MSRKPSLQNTVSCTCCGFNRREFLGATAATTAALHGGMATLASAVTAAEKSTPPEKPRVTVAFMRPEEKAFWMGWPGAIYDVKARTADYTKVLRDEAQRFGVELDVYPTPVWGQAARTAFAEKVKKDNPHGVILVMQHLHRTGSGRTVEALPDVPTVVFSPMGTSFHDNLLLMKKLEKNRRVYFASTPDFGWLAQGLRLLGTIERMKQTRICVVEGKQPADIVLDPIGTTLHYIPFPRFSQEYAKVTETDAVRAMARRWEKNAQKVVEPSSQDIIDAAKTYVVCQRLIEQEGCDGIAVDCLPHVRGRTAPPPCMAFSQLNDEGTVAACQADWPAAISLRLVYQLLGRPGYMNNMCSSSVNNTLIGAHCTGPLKLSGPEGPAAPYILRTHSESDLGVAPQVLWPEGEKITVMKFSHPRWNKRPRSGSPQAATVRLGSGRVVGNIDTPPSGGCRTSLEVELDGVDDVAEVNMLHHMLYVLGDHRRTLEAYCQLAGLKTESLIG